jgi:YD repeat-containing protein
MTTFSTKNQMPTPYQYDAVGNLTYDGTHHYAYDAEGHLTTVDPGTTPTATYSYNGDGLRTEKRQGRTVRDYVYDLSGDVLSEFDTSCAATTTPSASLIL